MELFLAIFLKIIPLYVFAILGFVAGKYLNIDAKGIGKLIIYIIAPFVIFEAITHSNLSLSTFILPIITFLILLKILEQYICRVQLNNRLQYSQK